MWSFNRHDLVWLSYEGRAFALSAIENCIPAADDGLIKEVIQGAVPIPAIVRRQDTLEDGLLCVGFSSPRIIDGVRLRVSCKVPLDCIVAHKTPFDVVQIKTVDFPAHEIIKTLVDEGRKYRIQVGCFGSAALQMVTGLSYWQKNSDVDIYLRHWGSWQELEQFFGKLLAIENQSGVTIEAELESAGGYGIKLSELFLEGKSVLGKGLYDVVLIPKSDITEQLSCFCSQPD
jgi:phosphoribosyl-dephospho-CoA transferase